MIIYWIQMLIFNVTLVSVPSALSIEERRLLESLDKLNEQLKSMYEFKYIILYAYITLGLNLKKNCIQLLTHP